MCKRLNWLTLIVSFALISATNSVLYAQQPCSATIKNRDAAMIGNLRADLRSTKLPDDDIGIDIPVSVQSDLTHLKNALAKVAADVFACRGASALAPLIQDELAKLLDANPPQPPPNTIVMNGDKRYAEWLAFEYGRNLLVNVQSLAPNLLSVEFTFHIPCGDDTMLMVFERDSDHWEERLLWQAPAYKEISGAFGDFFLTAVLPGATPNDWRLVIAHGKPWCTSRFSGFDIDVLAPQPNDPRPRVLWHTDRGYSRDNFAPTLKAVGDTFELRIHDDAMLFDPANGFERTVIYHYRVSGTSVARLEPIATNGRGFVEEWLSMPWPEAADQSLSASTEALQRIHHLYETSYPEHSNTYTSWNAGPVRACSAPKNFQVAFDTQLNRIVPGKPGGDEAPPSRTSSISSKSSKISDPTCSGPDLMSKPRSQPR
ncbi:MAG: hypothetical protein WBY53_19055 [Acidobacteriaceae bacterium]